MPRPPSHFRKIDTHINDAYGALRERVRMSGYLSAVTQSAPPNGHLLGFKVHHLRM